MQRPDDPTTHSGGAQLSLDLPVILPDVRDKNDQCVERLVGRLRRLRGITAAHVEESAGESRLCLHYDPNLVALAHVKRLAQDAGAELSRQFHHATLSITSMDSGDCALSIERVVQRMPGVLQVSVNYASEKMRVEFDSTEVSRQQISERVRSMGFEVDEEEPEMPGWLARHSELARSIAAGATLALAFSLEWGQASPALFLPIYILTYGLGGYDIARHGLKALARGQFTIDLLMTVAAAGAATLGDWAEGGLLLFLFSLGHALEEEAMDRARSAITALGKLSPKTARVRRQESTCEIPVAELERGDTVLVRAGERIPADGEVRAGQSAIDQSALTGESLPIEKSTGDSVFAGSVNGNGVLEVVVRKLASDSTLARVVALVSEAETQKSPTQTMVDRIARVFVPGTLIAVGLVWVVPPVLGWLPWSEAFLRAMAVLVSASPCALAIATPAAVLSALACAANRGVLIKGGVHLENLGRLQALAFDKTGTITTGAPVVTDVVPFGDIAPEELLATAAAVEGHSTHPLARAVVGKAREAGIEPPEATGVETLQGRGLRARIQGEPVLVGTATLVAEEGPDATPQAKAEVDRLEVEGKTVIQVLLGKRRLGAIAIADTARPGARETLGKLQALGLQKMIMLTGDHPRVAQAIAREVGLGEFRAELLPEDKLAVIDELSQRHGDVGMIGDGVNDAPALSRASVGIAMGAAGTDVALETADIALMADDISTLPFAIGLGRQTKRIITQNLVVALGVIAILVPLSIAGVTGIGWAVLLHEGSTLGVVGNALRLLSYRS